MKYFISLFLLFPLCLLAQKKPLDHTVYDGWQSIGERMISDNGKWVVYTVTPQEGDASLFIQATNGSVYKKEIARGYNAIITEDNRYAVFKVKPRYKDTREARIKKKHPDEFPKDSFGVVELGTDNVWKAAKIKSYKMPERGIGWIAYHKERESLPARQAAIPTQKTVDSLRKTIDSLVLLVTEIKNVKGGNRDASDADEEPSSLGTTTEGSDLVIRHLKNGTEKTFRNVADYYFNKYGQKLLMKIVKSASDSFSRNGVVLYDFTKDRVDTIAKGGNDFKSFALTDDGSRAAFVAERDTSKSPQKFYSLYLYQVGADSAKALVDKGSAGMKPGMTVSENARVTFSKSGNRLLFGAAPIQPLKDTTLIDIDLPKLDVWHYNDDYLQTVQLFNLQNELKRSYTAVYDFGLNKAEQLGSKEFPTIITTDEGDGATFIAVTDTGRRVQSQWSGATRKDVYAIEVTTGNRTLVKNNHEGQLYPSSTGNYILLYDAKKKHYFVWNGKELKNITAAIKAPLYDEEHDTPSDAPPYGVMGWHQQDSFVYVYDRYNVWKVDPTNKVKPESLINEAASTKTSYRYIKMDSSERFIRYHQPLFFRGQAQKDKRSVIARYNYERRTPEMITGFDAHYYSTFQKSDSADAFIYSKENYAASPDLYFTALEPVSSTIPGGHGSGFKATKLSTINPQQATYNWGTAGLYHWKTFNGKEATGILYKPEDFTPAKKYPMLIYFYEKLSEGINQYLSPSPTPSRLNIPFYVSRGYLVFAPDISYTKGHPGNDAYNYIVSGAQALAKNKWVDGKNIGIQGQSWGGYQVAYLITKTGFFKAAWAGAPVVNMTSAYGGIRWEGGINRQFQYERTQSRIGATLWERPDLYIENSPLFHLPKVTTPIVIMSNDADGAVPWYQGIEMFTAMRRLGKKVWLLNYNGEAHNLVERRNRKDIQIRQQEYFDWLLKGAKPARWITEGVPAVNKGREWGLEIVE